MGLELDNKEDTKVREATIETDCGDYKVKCLQNGNLDHLANLPTLVTAEQYADCWLKGVKFVLF